MHANIQFVGRPRSCSLSLCYRSSFVSSTIAIEYAAIVWLHMALHVLPNVSNTD